MRFFDYDTYTKKMVITGECSFCRKSNQKLIKLTMSKQKILPSGSVYNRDTTMYVCGEACRNIVLLQNALK